MCRSRRCHVTSRQLALNGEKSEGCVVLSIKLFNYHEQTCAMEMYFFQKIINNSFVCVIWWFLVGRNGREVEWAPANHTICGCAGNMATSHDVAITTGVSDTPSNHWSCVYSHLDSNSHAILQVIELIKRCEMHSHIGHWLSWLH